jgi:hypothetical protein
MRIAFHQSLLAAFILSSISAFAGETDTLQLLGISKADLLSQYGPPKQILGPEEGYQTYEYPDGLGVVIHKDKIVQYVAKRPSGYVTDKGIKLGSDISNVTKAYGDFIDTEEVDQWLVGNKQRTLYHHPKHDGYKINYAESDLVFMFDKNKKVESIWVGYIFPKE